MSDVVLTPELSAALQTIEDAPIRRLTTREVATLPLAVTGVYPVDEREGWVFCTGTHPTVTPIYFAWAWTRWIIQGRLVVVSEFRHLPRTNILVFDEAGEIVPGSGQNVHWIRRLMSFEWQPEVLAAIGAPTD